MVFGRYGESADQPPSLLLFTILFSQLRKDVACFGVKVLLVTLKCSHCLLPPPNLRQEAGASAALSPRVWTGAMAPCLPLGRGPFNSASQEPSYRDHPGRKHRQDFGMERMRAADRARTDWTKIGGQRARVRSPSPSAASAACACGSGRRHQIRV